MTEPASVAPEPPVASFVCITYNHATMIGRCLDGFLAQEVDFPVEMIVLDDASTDGTRDVLRRYAADHPGSFTLILPEVNSGLRRGNSLCEVIERARGEFILVCEGDDYWTDPAKAQTQVDHLRANPRFVFAFHDVARIDGEGREVAPLVPSRWRRDWSGAEILRGRALAFPLASLCFRNRLGSLPLEFLAAPNGDTFLGAMLATLGDGAYLGGAIRPSRSTLHAGGMYSSASDAERTAMALRTYHLLAAWLLRRGFRREARRLLAVELRLQARLLLRGGS